MNEEIKSGILWWQKYQLWIYIVGGIVIFGAGVYGWYTWSSIQNENSAQRLLYVAEAYFRVGDYNKALYGDDEALTFGFIDIIDSYSGTKAANIASYYSAISFLKLQNNEDALYYIERFKPLNNIIGAQSFSIYGTILANNERYAEAIDQYLQAADMFDSDKNVAYNLLQAALCSFEIGDYKITMEYLNRAKNNYPDNPFSDEIAFLMGRTEAKL